MKTIRLVCIGCRCRKITGTVYWSSSVYQYNEKIALTVYMISGNVNMDRKDLVSHPIRAVLAFSTGNEHEPMTGRNCPAESVEETL